MRTKAVTNTSRDRKINWALPNQKVSHSEFLDAIKKAEEGPFYSISEAKERLKQWKKERGL